MFNLDFLLFCKFCFPNRECFKDVVLIVSVLCCQFQVLLTQLHRRKTGTTYLLLLALAPIFKYQ